MSNTIRAAAASPYIKTGNVRHNIDEIIKTAVKARDMGAEMLVLPLNAVQGEGCGDLLPLLDVQQGKQHIYDEAKKLNIEIIFDSSVSGPVKAGGWKKTREYYKSLSQINNTSYIIASSSPSNTVTEGVYGGGLLICENGCILAERTAFSDEPNIIIADISLNLNKNPFFPVNKDDYPAFCNDILTIQKTALARRIEHAGVKKAVINISGGLDSAMALIAVCAAMDCLKRDRTDILALILPGFGTTERTLNNARHLTKALGAEVREIDIKPACLQHFKDIGHDPNIHNITYENVQARERSLIALNISNMTGGLMVGTGNMSELALGFTTYGGDSLSSYNPNCGLTKTAVREVISWVINNNMFGDYVSRFLNDILNTPVSPELLPPVDGNISQITEETVGPYELVDFFLYHMIKNHCTPEKIIFLAERAFEGGYSPEIIRRWLDVFIKRFYAGQFKRISMPEGPVILDVFLSPRSGFSMPGDVNYS